MTRSQPVLIRNPRTWPNSVRRATEAIASLILHSYLMARGRAAGHPFRIVRRLARAARCLWDARLLRRENRLLRRRLQRVEPFRRPHYQGRDRFAILQLMRLRGWTAKRTARRFVLHANTVRAWLKAFRRKDDVGLFYGHAPFNKLGDSVRWTVHQVRELCPEPHIGTRTIAMRIARAGIALSRSSVQRILREPPPPPKPASPATRGKEPAINPFHILRPAKVNRTWHLDLTTFEFLWVRFYVAALLDGFSRKLLALRVYKDAPNTAHMLALFRAAVRSQGVCRFLVTDHGCQFGPRFRSAVKRFGVTLVKGGPGKERACRFDGKVERFFKTLKLWQRLTLFAWKIPSIQRQLDVYRDWYNSERPMWLHGGRTPEEVWTNTLPPAATPIRAHEPQPYIAVKRIDFGDDPELPVLDIRIVRSVQRAA